MSKSEVWKDPYIHLTTKIQWYFNRDAKNRLGRLLTIIDATIVDQEQRKAIKDLMVEAYWRRSDTSFNKTIALLVKRFNVFIGNKPFTKEQLEFLGISNYEDPAEDQFAELIN